MYIPSKEANNRIRETIEQQFLDWELDEFDKEAYRTLIEHILQTEAGRPRYKTLDLIEEYMEILELVQNLLAAEYYSG